MESAKTVNEMTLNELVKLTTLWTTGPRLSDATIYDRIYSKYEFIKPFLDSKMSRFQEYGSFNKGTPYNHLR